MNVMVMNERKDEITISVLKNFHVAIGSCHSANNGSVAPPTHSTNQIALPLYPLRNAYVIKIPVCQS